MTLPVPTLGGIGKLVGSPPMMLKPLKNPCAPVRIPVPVMVTIDPGAATLVVVEKLAPFANLMLLGPVRRVVKVNNTVKVPYDAAMLTGPPVPPAVTVVEALPWLSVLGFEFEITAFPLNSAKLIGTPATPLPALSISLTTSADGNGVLTNAD